MRYWPFSRKSRDEVEKLKAEAEAAKEAAYSQKLRACVKLERAETLEQEVVKMNIKNGYSETLTFAFRGKKAS